VGAAVPEGIWERRLQILKEMGCNAIRMSHNPPAPELLDLCDRMGFLVMDEAFDEWRYAKGHVKRGYHELFDQWWRADAGDMLRRDRNHPSIVIWSAGNEIPDQDAGGADCVQPVGLIGCSGLRPFRVLSTTSFSPQTRRNPHALARSITCSREG
jgi:beta-galactosidase/beta-glucuronidase